MVLVNDIISTLGTGSIKHVPPELCGQVLCYAALAGLFQAFWRDFRMIWHGLVITVEQRLNLLPAAQKQRVQGYVMHFRKILSGLSGLGNTVYSTGQLLPSAVHKPGSESHASGMMLTGAVVQLDNGGFITHSEALMWLQVNPFSPSKTG